MCSSYPSFIDGHARERPTRNGQSQAAVNLLAACSSRLLRGMRPTARFCPAPRFRIRGRGGLFRICRWAATLRNVGVREIRAGGPEILQSFVGETKLRVLCVYCANPNADIAAPDVSGSAAGSKPVTPAPGPPTDICFASSVHGRLATPPISLQLSGASGKPSP